MPADDLMNQFTQMWRGLKRKTEQTLSQQQRSFVRGKVAGVAVTDEAGNVLVDAGHLIDDAVIERAVAANRLSALFNAAVTARAQDFREKAAEIIAGTPQGRENQTLSQVEQYAEARRYVGRRAGMAVTDIRGTVIVEAGTEITEQVVIQAREANLLGALIFSAQQPAPAAETPVRKEESPAETSPIEAEIPLPTERPVTARTTLPVVHPPVKRSEEGEAM
jgi:hypothetical protein